MTDRSGSQAVASGCKYSGTAICHFPSSGNKRSVSQGFCYQICDQAAQAGGHGFEVAELTGGPLLSVREVAAVLRVSTATVYALIERGEIVHVRVSNAIRISAAAVVAYTKRPRSDR